MNTLVAYVPVIHRGYLELFARHVGKELYVLGESLLLETPHLKMDMRAVDPQSAATMARSLGVFSRVLVLETWNLSDFTKYVRRITMPDEEVSHAVAEKFFGDCEVVFSPVFLRWHKKIVAAPRTVCADRAIAVDEIYEELLQKAVLEGKQSSDWWRQVGAVVAKEGQVLFSAHNHHQPSEHTPYVAGDPRSNFVAGERIDLSTALHAEVAVITEAAKLGVSLDGADMFVSTFPCPSCAYAIAHSGIARVFYAEGYSLLEGEQTLRSKGVELVRVDLTPSP